MSLGLYLLSFEHFRTLAIIKTKSGQICTNEDSDRFVEVVNFWKALDSFSEPNSASASTS